MRILPKPMEIAVEVMCVLTAIFYIWRSWVGTYPGMGITHVGILMGVCLILTFLYYPLSKKQNRIFPFIDGMLILATIVILFYFMQWEHAFDPHDIREPPDQTMTNFGVLLIIIILEATRRVMGWALVILAGVLLLYNYFGNYMPEAIAHSGFSLKSIITYAIVEETGVWGIAMQVASTMIIIFIILASLIRTGGGSEFFLDLPKALFGRVRGGPAKVAVVASGFFGTISGSAAANVVTTGTFTIPMMKKIGYESHIAGAVEVVASAGGPFMPPVMGAVAFVMSEMIGVPYWSICVAAFIPAVVYYTGIFAAVDLHAAKLGLKGEAASELPNAWKVFKGGWFLLIPLALLVYLIGVMHWGPTKAGFVCVITMFLVSLLTKKTRLGPRKLWFALNGALRDAVVVVVACACAGFIIGMVGLTGLGIMLSQALIQISQGSILILLVLTALTALLLGMGMSAIPCYIFLAILIGPALRKMGLPLLPSHLFILYFGLLSVITPPVAIAAYAAAPIAGDKPFKIGFTAMRLAPVAYILPFFFIYSPALIMAGAPAEIALSAITAIIGVACIAAASEGYLLHKLFLPERILIGLAGLGFITHWYFVLGIGAILLAAALAIHLKRRKASTTAKASAQ
ncbi:TRAP transporter permease [Chloroflexota bacterium]